MTEVFIKLINMSIVAGWLVLAVLLLRLLLKKAPRWIFCVLWAFVALRLLIPFSVQSETSAVPSVDTIPPEIIYIEKPYIHSGLNTFNGVFNPIISDILSSPEADNVIETEPKETPAKKIIDIASVVWLCGMAGMAVYGIISYTLLKRKVREAVPKGKGIFICDNVTSPFIIGIFRPRIYLPSSVSETDAEMVIAHEKAHIKRKDHLWKPFGFILLAVYWFNPLLWVAYVTFCKDIESACDEKVIKKYGYEIKKQYSEALLNCSVSGKWITACPVAFGETSVKSRIKGVLNYKKPAFWVIIAAILACIAISVFFLTDPMDAEDDISIPPWCQTPDDEALVSVQLKGERKVYENGYYSSAFYPEYALPQFAVTTDNRLLTSEKSENKGFESAWTEIGTLVKTKLTKSNFDDICTDFEWFHNYSAEYIREKAQDVYICKAEDDIYVYYLIYLDNGTTLIAFGYEDEKYSSIRAIAEYSEAGGIKSEYILPKLEYVAYMYTIESEDPYPREVATVYLEKDGNHFTYGYETFVAQNYCPYGTYRKDGGKLYLETADGKNRYVFNIKGESIEYVAESSSQLPMTVFTPEQKLEFIADNAVFVKENKTVTGDYAHVSYLVFQSAFKDVDGDGQKELCVIADGPTSGVSSTMLAIYAGCDYKESGMITFETARFITDADGSVQLVFGSETDERYEFRVTDEGIICTNTETGEERPFANLRSGE